MLTSGKTGKMCGGSKRTGDSNVSITRPSASVFHPHHNILKYINKTILNIKHLSQL